MQPANRPPCGSDYIEIVDRPQHNRKIKQFKVGRTISKLWTDRNNLSSEHLRRSDRTISKLWTDRNITGHFNHRLLIGLYRNCGPTATVRMAGCWEEGIGLYRNCGPTATHYNAVLGRKMIGLYRNCGPTATLTGAGVRLWQIGLYRNCGPTATGSIYLFKRRKDRTISKLWTDRNQPAHSTRCSVDRTISKLWTDRNHFDHRQIKQFDRTISKLWTDRNQNRQFVIQFWIGLYRNCGPTATNAHVMNLTPMIGLYRNCGPTATISRHEKPIA